MLNKKIEELKKKLAIQNNPLVDFMKKKYIEKKRDFISYRCYERQYEEIRENLTEEFSKIFNFSNDYEPLLYEEEFEKRIAKYCSCKYAVGMSSGTAALQFYLAALNLSEENEVITVANTHVGTLLAITNLGLRPVFIDIKKDHTINTELIKGQITEKTKLILPVHMYGYVCDMHELLNISRNYKIPLFEDSAQAFGSLYHSKLAPFTGEGFFSFHTSKNFGGLGNGGLILTNNKNINNRLKAMKNLEFYGELLRLSKRTPSSLDSIQTAFLNAKLSFLNTWTKKRRENAKLYNEELRNTSLILPIEKNGVQSNYHSYVVRTKKRDKLKKFLEKNKIETKVEYPYPLHLTNVFKDLGFVKGSLPVTEQINQEILSLPINPFLKKDELKKIIDIVRLFDKKINKT